MAAGKELSASCEKLTGHIAKPHFPGYKTRQQKTHEITEIEPGINKERMKRSKTKQQRRQQEQKAFRMSKHKQFSKRHDAAAEQPQRKRGAEGEGSSEQMQRKSSSSRVSEGSRGGAAAATAAGELN